VSQKAQSAYTQFIKDVIEDVRRLKESGYDVTECNRLLQSLVSAVLEQDYTCADYLINELNATIANLRSTVPIVTPAVPHHPSVVVRDLGEVNAVFRSGYYHVVPVLPAYRPRQPAKPSTLIVVLLYSFLFLFVVLIFTLINYVLRWS